ncbi:LamG-like jellyroll fold domain-containing protein [Carboxylicivirga caseinilyticus]|uniref:LamG-like jellyroll fold domain-containing protein n=1 Tax=Carboxylicivirga caseinilyticus TaxID=3417572 RepID=UPI003D33938A|nr:T9SS type A sorting domain-containing protein [Marinilabiliaceae bacterium A049]
MRKSIINQAGSLVVLFILFVNTINISGQNSLNFDGINDYVSVDNGVLNDLQTATIEMWVKWNGSSQAGSTTNSTPRYGAVIARQKNSVFSNQIIALSESNPTTASITWRPYRHNVVAITSSVSPGNEWIHLAVCYTSGEHKMYVNGNLVGSSTLTGSVNNDISIPFTIGAWIGDGNSYGNVNIAELRVWNVLRTEEQIQNNMNISLNGNEDNLIAYYTFNQGIANGDNTTVTSLTDLSINNNNGVLNNFSLTGTTSNWVDDTGFIPTALSATDQAEIVIYPNPATDYISIKGISGTADYMIYNSVGEKLLGGKTLNNQMIGIKKLSKGIYFLKVENEKPIVFVKE